MAFTLPNQFPPMPAVARILSRFDREQLNGFIAVAIDLADAMEPDPDLEPEEDMGEEERGENRTWIETIDQRRLAANALAFAQSDDDAEEDDPSGQCDEDGINTAGATGFELRGAGCPIADPGGGNVTDDPHDYDEDGI